MKENAKIIKFIIFGLFVFFLIGSLLEVFWFHQDNYCPFKYGEILDCKNVGNEYWFDWLRNRIWWPLDLIAAFILNFVGGPQ